MAAHTGWLRSPALLCNRKSPIYSHTTLNQHNLMWSWKLRWIRHGQCLLGRQPCTAITVWSRVGFSCWGGFLPFLPSPLYTLLFKRLRSCNSSDVWRMLFKEQLLTWNGAIFLVGDATAQKILGWYKLPCLVLMLLEQTRLPILQFVPHLSCRKAAL